MSKQTKLQPTDLKLITIRSQSLGLDSDVGDLRKLSKELPSGFVAIVNEANHPVGIVPKDDTPYVSSNKTVPRKRSFFDKLQKSEPEEDLEQKVLLKDIMLTDPLIIEYGTAVDVLMERTFSRQGSRFDEDIILVNQDGTYFGLITSRAVSRLLYGFLGSHMTALRVQKEEVTFQHSQVVQVKRDLELTNQKLEIARDKALEGERMKNSFLANMSHEIRTPMNGVFGMIDLLNDTELDDDQEQLLGTARSSAETLMRIINDILDFSKIEAGKVSVESIPFELTEIVESSVALYSESASEKELELNLIFEDVPPWVIGDPHRYQQVLNNLISNAIKFTDEGRVNVIISGVATESGPGILTEITDTGMGIPAGKIDELFKPFTQVDETTVRKFGGTGLGLSICSNLVDLMDGTIECDSVLGEGTSFSYVLPFDHYKDEKTAKSMNLVNERQSCSSTKLSDRTDFSGTRVLLVEDNIVNQEVAKRFLAKLNCDVVTAENGQVALEYLSVENFDCIFMDCQMPVLDGYAATDAIRNGKAGHSVSDIFISAMTAQAMAGDREKCSEVGMDHYFSKPFGFQDFRKALLIATERSPQNKGSRLKEAIS